MENKKVAILLSGCGYLDGSEINEVVLTLLALDRLGVSYEGVVLDKKQVHVINHVSMEDSVSSERNMLEESARIMRGNVKGLSDIDASDYAAVIIPGGFGMAKNLSDFAFAENGGYSVDESVLEFLKAICESKKPMGFLCIAPIIIPHVYPEGVKMTIGNDKDIAQLITSKGAKHIDCLVDEICYDERHKVISTPAYMLGKNNYEVSKGIDRLVKTLTSLIV